MHIEHSENQKKPQAPKGSGSKSAMQINDVIEHKEKLFFNVLQQLRDTPFLDMGLNLDVDKLQYELKGLVLNGFGYADYTTKHKLARRFYRKSWSGVCLSSADGGLYSDLSEGDNQKTIDRPKATPAAEHCPYMLSIVKALGGDIETCRARIMRIAPGRSLLWHSHVQEHLQPDHILTIQVPIFVPKKFRYCVVHSSEFRWYKRFRRPESFMTLAEKRLTPGDAYIFNSYHYHNVYNGDNEHYRETLMIYIDLRKDNVLDLVARSLSKNTTGNQCCSSNRRSIWSNMQDYKE